MPNNLGVINAAQAWILLKTEKVTQLGFEPCLFVPGWGDYVVICHWGWDDGGQHLDGDTEYTNSEFDKRLFINSFRSQYPFGLIIDEDYRSYLSRVKQAKQATSR